MTAQQAKTISHINENLAAERHNADQAGREVAQLDARSVLVAIEVKLNEGRIEEAKKIYQDWKAGQL